MRRPRPYPHLVRDAGLAELWMIRMLLDHGASSLLLKPDSPRTRDRVLARLGLRWRAASAEDANEANAILERLRATEATLSNASPPRQLAEPLRSNLARLGTMFRMSKADIAVLGLAIQNFSDPGFRLCANATDMCLSLARTLADVLGVTVDAVRRSKQASGCLRRCQLVEFHIVQAIGNALTLERSALAKMAEAELADFDEILGQFLQTMGHGILAADDYPHLSPGPEVLAGLLARTLDGEGQSLNLLVYGAPGTGKTELARLLARMVGADLYQVAFVGEDGTPSSPTDRLRSLMAARTLLESRRAVLCFDEIDALFAEGSAGLGGGAVGTMDKIWLNAVLEQPGVPTVWIANRIDGVDPALVRRFDVVLRLDAPPRGYRRTLLERRCGDLLERHEIDALADQQALTPAVIERASRIARRARDAGCAPPARGHGLATALMAGVLRAQGHRVRLPHSGQAAIFDPALCRASHDLEALATALSDRPIARLCLEGPPGTGKSGYGRWLATRLDRPHLVRRLSDLRSPWVGVFEQRLAEAFDEARSEGAVLQLDEVDSLLGARDGAMRSWEIDGITELLTQLEGHEGIVVATTNRSEHLDPAALRRFDQTIRFDYLDPDRATRLTRRIADALRLPWCDLAARRVAQLPLLAPGDFAVVSRRHALQPFGTLLALVDALEAETRRKAPPRRRIGLV